MLLNAWGRASPYLLSALERTQLDRLVRRAEDDEKRLAVLTDQRLRETADELRSSPLLRHGNVDELRWRLRSRERPRGGIAACVTFGFSCSAAPS